MLDVLKDRGVWIRFTLDQKSTLLLLSWALLFSSCSDQVGPGNSGEAGIISDLSILAPNAVCPSRSAGLMATIEGMDSWEGSYVWEADGGQILGEGSSVGWNAPEEEGFYKIFLTVMANDGAMGRDSIQVEVREGTLLFNTWPSLCADPNIHEVDRAGSVRTLRFRGGVVDAYGDRVFSLLRDGTIVELDTSTWEIVGEARAVETGPFGSTLRFENVYRDLVTLPGGRFAVLDNGEDMLWVVDSTGAFLGDIPIWPQQGPSLQSMAGVLVDGKLHACCTEDNGILVADVDLFGSTTYKIPGTSAWSREMVYSFDFGGGHFFYGTSTSVLIGGYSSPVTSLREFASSGSEYHHASLVVVGPYLYSAVNHVGKIYRYHRFTGETELVAAGLTRPDNLVCLPTAFPSK